MVTKGSSGRMFYDLEMESEDFYTDYQEADDEIESLTSAKGYIKPDNVYREPCASDFCDNSSVWSQPVEEWVREGETLDLLVELSIRKIYELQMAQHKSEHRRVMIVNMLHSLLMRKIQGLKEEGGLIGEDSNLLNGLLQEKILGLGLGRSVRIWVEPPTQPGQDPLLKIPSKLSKKNAKNPAAVDVDERREGTLTEENQHSLAPSEREPAVL